MFDKLVGMSDGHNKNLHVSIVKVTTSYFYTGNKLRMQKDVRTLKRLSKGHDYFTEEFNNVEAHWLAHDLDLTNVKDGIYEVLCCESYDEYGTCDDVTFSLKEVTE